MDNNIQVNDFIKFVELIYPLDKQEFIKKSLSDYHLFLEQFKFKEEVDDDEEEVEDEIIIYQICSVDESITDCYVGRTRKSMEERFYHHKKTCENPNYKYYHKFLYDYMRKNGGVNNWKILELEKFVSKNKFEIREKEQYWIDKKNATLNKIRANRLIQE